MNSSSGIDSLGSSPKAMRLSYWGAFAVLASIASVSFWLFSRFTVDDAFITWRYGKNLIDSGVWGYNPTSFDLTQAYTNPVYAALGIIPHLLGVDVVLFFKIVSVLLVSVFAVWFSRRTKAGIFVALLYAVPATFIHAFSGLETFLYVILLTALFIFILEDKFWSVHACAVLLFMTRPESWAFLGLIPMFYFLPKALDNDFKCGRLKSVVLGAFDFRSYNYKIGFLSFFILGIPLLTYFYFHKLHFGYAMPNTFYVKSGGAFNPFNFVYFSLSAMPILIFLAAFRLRAFFVAFLFFGAVIVSYSTSSLAMNYVDRFAFHIVVPAYLMLVYVAAKLLGGSFYVSFDSSLKNIKEISYKSFSFLVAFVFISFFGLKNLAPSSLVHIANYYPRALDSHASLGKAINEDSASYGFEAMSFGDAGMTAYHSGLVSLDNIGLGSSLVAQVGVSEKTISDYNPAVVVFHARPEGIRLDDYSQDTLYSWARAEGYSHVCQVYWKPNYTLNIYSRYQLNSVLNVCESSKSKNDVKDKSYFLKQVATPPWYYWHT